MKDSRILFYGALGNGKKFTVGGGETGNHRTIKLLQKNGYEVITLHKPYPVKNIIGYFIYSIRMFLTLFSFFFTLRSSGVKVVHISGFYLHLIYHEYLLVKISRLLKIKCIYELRGGGVIEAYKKRSFIYRQFFNATINNASVLLCQGESYIQFLKNLTEVEIFHYPNYVLDDFMLNGSKSDRKNDSSLQLVYFGRIVQSKNLDFLLTICKELTKQQVEFNLEIIGSGDEDYIRYLKEIAEKENLNSYVSFSGPMGPKQLNKKLTGKHFFLFPSNEKREGHSNALTEAMALGIVPVCSNAGFNAEIVNDKELVVNEYDPHKYIKVIRKLWENNRWDFYSNKAISRIKNNYTEQIAEKILLEAYEN